jgi:hypothetical protein
MARRRSPIVNFLEGFNAGWDTVGKVGSAFEVSRLEDEEKRIREATQKGGKGLQADADGNYSVFGMSFDTKPTDFDISYARNTRQADIYDRYGQKDFARSLRADAKNDRIQGQQYAFNQEYNPLRLEDARAGIASKRATTQATTLANEYARGSLQDRLAQAEANRKLAEANVISVQEANRLNKLLFPEKVKQSQLTTRSQELGNLALESNNRVLTATENDRIEAAGLGNDLTQQNIESVTRSNDMNQETYRSTVDAAIAQNNATMEMLPAQVKEAIANGDRADLARAFDVVTFDSRADQLRTSANLSQEQLDQMIEENPYRLQGLIDSNILTGLNIDEAKLNKTQREQVAAINQGYYNALVNGDYSGVTNNIMPFAAEVYNDPNIRDDGFSATQGEDGKWVIQNETGETVGTAEDILRSASPDEQRSFIRQAQAYAVASITGDYAAIDELYKTDAWIDYYQAQAEAKRRGSTLTKDQWALNRLNENPLDRLALAMLLPTGTYQAIDFEDPAEVLAISGGLGNGNRPPPKTEGGGGNGGDQTAQEPSATPPGLVLLQNIQNSGGITGSRPSLTEYANSLAEPPSATGIASRNNSRNADANAQTLSALSNPAVLDEAIRYQQQRVEALQTNQPSGNARRGADSALTKAQQLLEELIAYRQSLGQPTR